MTLNDPNLQHMADQLETLHKQQAVPRDDSWRRELSESPTRSEPRPSRPVWNSPQTTASGIDAAVIRHLPWQAQKAVAREPNREKAAALVERFSDPLEAEVAAMPGGELHDDVTEWAAQWDKWARDTRTSLEDVQRAMGGEAAFTGPGGPRVSVRTDGWGHPA
ncbi:MAG: hypothetical protein ABR529_06520 [Actinomycetota bacterium]